jgi:tetratricopeptide (TPR) repeat protein
MTSRLAAAWIALVLAGCASEAERRTERAERSRQLLAEADQLREDQRYGDERSRYEAMISLDEQAALPHFRKGVTLMREAELAGKESEQRRELFLAAIGCFDQALALDKTYLSAYVNRAECNRNLYLIGHPDEQKYLRRALDDLMFVTHEEPRHASASKLLGYILHYIVPERQAKQRAVYYYRKHLEVNPGDAQVEQWLDKVLRQYGDPDLEAAAEAREPKSRKPPAKPKPEDQPAGPRRESQPPDPGTLPRRPVDEPNSGPVE